MNGRDPVPKVGVAILFGSMLWIIISVVQWGFRYLDMSQLLFALLFGVGGMYLAYDQWFKRMADNRYEEYVQIVDNVNNWKLKVQDNIVLEDKK